MRLPLWLKVGWTLWLLLWAPLYWRQYGPQNFLFFCDLGNILIGLALWLESPLIFSWQATGLLLFQSLYIIDLAGALLGGRHFIGGPTHLLLWKWVPPVWPRVAGSRKAERSGAFTSIGPTLV